MTLLQAFLLVYFQYFCLSELLVFAYSLILSGLKVKNYLKENILIIKNYKMVSRHYYFKTKNYPPSRMRNILNRAI